ncbi:transcription factor HIVEP3 isoform X2 [Homalodisca vitripennis]|uniref:transcription factor HIVEP3 isoform X2 n=1 Tax=Homalodisca vitripennis TaxID=197043 RepID=UPI001EEC4FFA|nr:transcription factor HIVEP3 isoform X2 [Homalodisca vitripennis]
MPRRKGHGIPPTKRVKQPDAISRSAPLKNKLYNEIPALSGKEEPIQMTVNAVPIKSEPPSIISDALHSKYLHKKFKKMASTLLPEETNNVLNGRFNKGGSRVSVSPDFSDSEKVMSPPENALKSDIPPTSRVISPPAGRYVCSYCKLACAKPSVLQKHIRAHTNERPYPCLPCGFAFKTKSNLYKHCRSRAHASKLEERGEKVPLYEGEEAVSSEEDDSLSNTSNAASVTSKAENDQDGKEEIPKSIYKPKYRFMDQPLKSPLSEKLDERKENTITPPRLHLNIPVPNATPSVSTPSPFTSGSSPSPEFLHRHINKIISENQAIVETNDPFWTKKFLQRTNSSDNNSSSSPLSTSPSPADVNLLKKIPKYNVGPETLEEVNCDKTVPKHSKLALALLRPQSSVSPKFANHPAPVAEVCDVQPLNLSTNNKEQSLANLNRKRSYSEGFPDRSPKALRDRVNAVPLKILNYSVQDFRRFASTLSENSAPILLNHLDIKKEIIGTPQNPEGSIIKDLLLKARAAGSTVSSSIGPILGTPGIDLKPHLSLTPPVSDERAYSPSSQFVCHLCKEPIGYRNAESLEIHQLYHCKGNDTSSRSSLNSPSPHADLHHPESPYRKSVSKEGPILIAPSHPSPGPLLGSTPLVDSYRTKSPHTPEPNPTVLKKRKFDTGAIETRVISATTLRSLEELSKSPMRSNLQMFGGEVKILDSPGGEAKTMRIDPLRGSSKTPSDIPLQVTAHPGKNMTKEESDLQDSSNMVVKIAKQGLHSGGSIVQVPHKPVSSEHHSPRQNSTSRPMVSGSPAPHRPGFQEPSKMLIPIIPGASPQNISLSGISNPVQLPFIPFTSILSESNVINPLTNITAYNPLTLPPASMIPPSSPMGITNPYSSGIVTILHGGKEIPYVPGMPGPHTLLPNHSVPIFSSKLEPESKLVKLPENTANTYQEQLSRGCKNERAPNQSVINKPSSLSIPTIQVNSETMESPVDQSTSSGANLRKRSIDESQSTSISKPSTPKKSQFILPEEDETEPKPEKKFLRPTSLPLKPGTFVPKRQQLTPVLSLVSPETPRPRKSYGQLYLNGHAYTYLGLKCSTRTFFCTLNKPQPIYVPLSPEHNRVSMYSNWKVCTEADPNPYGLDPGRAMALYDSRHRPATYTLAQSHSSEAVTHSAYWTNRHSPDDREETPEAIPKRVKIFAGGFESNEDYIYIRGRGRGRYVCEECGIRCKKPSMLKKHIRTHTDVRPFTCIHCKFSFKTKGNLTKHMKSKAHYKKCSDLGIDPVPTVVDESYVDEVALAHQQALRETQGVDPEESEEEEEEEDETEDDDDEDEDDAEGGEDCVEREAARSLLTLSETLQSATQMKKASEGLLSMTARPSTYPYSFTSVTETAVDTQPQTPTLTAISAQREREKVSQNTGLAREVQGEGRVKAGVEGEGIVRGGVEETQSNSDKGVAARYYFPSSHDLGDSVPESSGMKQSTPIDLSNKPADKSPRVCEAAMLLASLCSTMERLPTPTTTTAAVSEDSTLLQAYLTERAVQDSRMKQHQYKHKPPVNVTAGLNISAAKENALGILAQTSSDARKLPTSEPQTNKPQAEFLPPSSAPSPSYVSVLEDGRSMCNMCNKVFSKPSQLRLHVNIHYFERPFRCESCAVSFRTKGHLQKHQRSVSHLNKVSMNSTFGTATTSNPRPFKCDDCKIAFRIHGHLAKHLRSKMHIMKLECLGKLPFGTYAEMERSGINMNDIDTTDCDNSLESLQLLAQKLYEKDPSKLGQWDPSEMLPHPLSAGDSSSEGEEDIPLPLPPPSATILSPVQRFPPPALQKAILSTVQEPVKCVINIRNPSVNHKGPKHKTEGADEPVSDRRTDEPGESQ